MQYKKSCAYYQARVQKELAWFFVATLRSDEHLVFVRTLDQETSLFEFFVPESREELFCSLMHYYEDLGIVSECRKLPNRLLEPNAVF